MAENAENCSSPFIASERPALNKEDFLKVKSGDIVLRDDWQDADSWNKFVECHEEARYCHLFHYPHVLGCYGYAPRNICFIRNNSIVGVLPATLVRNLFYKRKIISQPFSEYGGLLLDPSLDGNDIPQVFSALMAYGQRHSDAMSIEMHGNHGVPELWHDKWTVSSLPHHVAVLPLRSPADELWRKVVRYSVRKAVNQARERGLYIVSQCDEDKIKSWFFPMYLKSMKRLGVPPHTIEYYLNCHRILRDRMIIMWAMKGSTVIAGLLGFRCGSRVNIVNTVSDPDEWHLRPNDLLHWEFIKWAAETGHKYFDFGSVRYQGQLDYKKKWGCELLDHKYHVMNLSGSRLAPPLNSSSAAMKNMAALWSKYVPIIVGQTVGPYIRKHLAR